MFHNIKIFACLLLTICTLVSSAVYAGGGGGIKESDITNNNKPVKKFNTEELEDENRESNSKNPTIITEETESHILRLPREILCLMTELLDKSGNHQSVINLAVTCKGLYKGLNEQFWQAQFGMLSRYLHVFNFEEQEKPKDQSWQNFYKSFDYFGTETWCLEFLGNLDWHPKCRPELFNKVLQLIEKPNRIDILNVAVMAGMVEYFNLERNQYDKNDLIISILTEIRVQDRVKVLRFLNEFDNRLKYQIEIGGGGGLPIFWASSLKKYAEIPDPFRMELKRSIIIGKIYREDLPQLLFTNAMKILNEFKCCEDDKLRYLIQARHVMTMAANYINPIYFSGIFNSALKSDLVTFDQDNFPNQDEIQELAIKLTTDEKKKCDSFNKHRGEIIFNGRVLYFYLK